jgi:hypothetical protein
MMRSPPPADVPTLTEVVVPSISSVADQRGTDVVMSEAGESAIPALAPALVAEIDALIAQRLGAALETAWRQLLPTLIDDVRSELAPSLREVIHRAAADPSGGHRQAGLVRSIPAASSTDADTPGSAGLPR